MNNISGTIKTIRDIMRKDAGVDGDAQRISQMVWMLFLKIFSDKEQEWRAAFNGYESPIPLELKWENWAVTTASLQPENLVDFINKQLFPTLREISDSKSAQSGIVRAVFEDTHNYMKNGALFRQVVDEINKIDFSRNGETHVFNEIYESILKELQSAGSSGEYYTPRAVTQFMVEMVNPRFAELVLDPACGTGGFLTCAIDHIRQNHPGHSIDGLQQFIRGVEKKPLPHLLCTTNLMLHQLAIPKIIRGNLLMRNYDDVQEKDKVDVILSNPPFGGIEEDGTEKNFPREYQSKETSDLFLLLIISLLKAKGRAAVILPDGTLFGDGVKARVKEFLLNECNLHTIVRLKNGVFNPYTSIKTNILFFEKGLQTTDIWYYEMPYPKGVKGYNKSRSISSTDFDLVRNWWNNRIENENAWRVSFDDVVDGGFNLDLKHPKTHFDEVKPSSDELFHRLLASFERSRELLDDMKRLYDAELGKS